MQLLPLIAWVINITLSFALPKNITLYKVWFKQKPLTNLSIYKGKLCRCYIRGVEEECDKNKNFDKRSSKRSSKGSSKGSSKREDNKEE